MRLLRSQHGQATVDYVALIAFLAVLLGAAAAVAGVGAPNVANAVLAQVRRALCVVTGGSCPSERQQPCVVAGDRTGLHVAVSFAVFRVDSDRTVAIERMSDGTVRLTLSRRAAAGVEVGAGVRARLRLRGRALGSEREARAGVEGVLGYGEVFVAHDADEAKEILRKLLRPRLPFVGDRPSSSEVFVEGGVRALGRLGIGAVLGGASLDAMAEGIVGGRRDRGSGEIALSLNAGTSGWGLLSALMTGPSRSSDRNVGLELRLDRRGRPIALSLKSSGNLAAGETFVPSIPAGRGFTRPAFYDAGMDGRRWELEARADLRDPDVAAAWAAFRHDPANPAAQRSLGELLRDKGRLDVRTYELRSEAVGGAAGVALALKLGGEFEHARDVTRLLSAATRPPDGLWEQRIDCVTA